MATKIYGVGAFIAVDQGAGINYIPSNSFDFGFSASDTSIKLVDLSQKAPITYSDTIANLQDKNGVAIGTVTQITNYISSFSGLSPSGQSLVKIDSPLTAFGEILTAQLSPVFQLTFEYTVDNTELGTIEKLGTGTVTQSDAMCVVSTGVTTGSTAEWESSKNATYKAGMGGVVRFTALFTTGVAGTQQTVGLADVEGSSASHKNGYSVGYNGDAFSFLRWQNDVLFPIPQSSWDDPMDGTGASGMTLDPTKLNVYFIQFQYLGAGAVKLWIENDATGKMVLAHNLLYSNLNTVPSIYNPNFHLMIHALNGVTTSDLIVKSASMAYFIEGETKYTEIQQPQQSTGKRQKTSVTTQVALFTIRNKSTYVTKDNFMDIILENISASIEASSANNLGEITLTKNATLGGTPAWVDINTTDSIVDIDVSGTTVTGGKTIMTINMAGKNDRDIVNLTDFDLILVPGDTLTVSGTSANSATFNASMLWKELF